MAANGGECSDQSLKLSATTCSDQSVARSPRRPSIETRVCLVGAAAHNETLIQALKNIAKMEILIADILPNANGRKQYIHSIAPVDIDIPHLTSKDGSEYVNCDDPYYETIFVLEEFDGEIFQRLKNSDNRVLGSPVVLHVAATSEPLPYTYRPQYCNSMQGLNLCFTNFKTKEHLTRLVTLCHYMGACIRKDMSAKIDFLITNVLHGPKYRTAVSLGIPVIREDWIHLCWEARRRNNIKASDEEFIAPSKSKPFEGCTLSFLGFSEDESKHMRQQAEQQGARTDEAGNPTCSHLIVDETNVKSLPFTPHEKLLVVIQEWFWGSIQIEARAAESIYIYEMPDKKTSLSRSSTTSSLLGTPKWRNSNGETSVSRSSSSSKHSFSRKRSRLREETLAKLAQDSERDTSTKQPPSKRASTDTSTCINESLLDISNNATSIRSPRAPDLFKDSPNGKHRKRNPLAQRRFRLKEFRSPRSSDTKQRRILREDMRQSLSRNQLQNIKSELQHDGIGNGRKSMFLDKRNENVQRKRKSLVLQGSIASSLSPRESRESPRKIHHSRKKRRMSLGVGVTRLTRRSCRILKRLSFGDEMFDGDSVFRTVDEQSTIEEEKEVSETINQLSHESHEEMLHRVNKEKDVCLEESFLYDEDVTRIDISDQEENVADSPNAAKASVSARYQVAMEFLQTEKNYVGILSTILNVFKKPLEDPKQAGGAILPSENVKAIFGSLPEIHSVHTLMVADLTKTMQNWNDTSCIGCIVNKYAKEFVRCYPPFVNFFEMSKDTISTCESTLPRFHAFLKINQAKKECGRQTLAELLINPVQRLPRIILLLQDIKKHTERENSTHPDVAGIQTALDAVKEVMTHINEDKRKTESQKQIFDIVYEVEGCPPTIVSSHRQFITRAELIAVDDNLCNKGDHVTLILFSDCVELAKRKKGLKTHSFKSPNVHNVRNSAAVRCLKHIKLMSLSHIKKVVDIKNSEDCQSAFSLFCRTPTDSQDWLYTFKLLSCTSDCGQQNNKKDEQQSAATLSEDEGKLRLMQLIARHRANTVCKASDDNFVHSLASHELDVCTSDIGSTLGRAVRAAKKSHKKLTRAFSFSRTPRRVVQRAVSNMMSPSGKQMALPSSDSITPGLGTTPSRSGTSSRCLGSQFSVDLCDMEHGSTSSSGLTPSMSVSSLCTPQRDRRTRLPSTASLQVLSDTFPAETAGTPYTECLDRSYEAFTYK